MNEFENLYLTIKDRKQNPEAGSYTAYLFDKGLEKILKKVGEEACEVVIAAMKDDKSEQVKDGCDLMYHLMVLLAQLDIPLADICEELGRRSAKTHNLKAERKPIEKL